MSPKQDIIPSSGEGKEAPIILDPTKELTSIDGQPVVI
jgi:hypothetical protein